MGEGAPCRMLRNGEKVRVIFRIRRMLETLNDSSDEHYMLVTAHPDTNKHLSLYGSRRLIKAAHQSDLRARLGEEELTTSKTNIFMPIVDVSEKPEESKSIGESELYASITGLLDLYNYPQKEHFSFKSKGQPSHLRPKPNFWPRDIKYVSLLGCNISDIIEPFATQQYLTRKDIMRKVLAAVKSHYKTFVDRMDGVAPVEEIVDIEHVTNGIEMDEEGNRSTGAGYKRNSPSKRAIQTKKPKCDSGSAGCLALPPSASTDTLESETDNRDENGLLSSSAALNSVWFVQPGTSTARTPPANPGFNGRWHSNRIRYEIKRPKDSREETTPTQPPEGQSEKGPPKRYIIDGQEYALVDNLDPADEVFYEYDESGLMSYVPGNTEEGTEDLRIPRNDEWKVADGTANASSTDYILNQTNYALDEAEKSPQLIRTVVVNKQTGPVLQKHVIKLKKQ